MAKEQKAFSGMTAKQIQKRCDELLAEHEAGKIQGFDVIRELLILVANLAKRTG